MPRPSLWATLAAVCLSVWLNGRGITWGILESPGGELLLLHPDESANRFAVLDMLRTGTAWRNPEDGVMVYYFKGLLFYTELKALARAVSRLAPPGSRRFCLLARRFVALQGTLCVVLAGLIGWRAFSPPVGALAALFLSVCPGQVIDSHYMRQDIPASLWILAALFFCVEIARGKTSIAWLIGAGACAGLAVATKHSSWPVLAALAAAAWRARHARPGSLPWLLLGFGLVLGAADPILWAEPGAVRKAAGMLAWVNRHGAAYHPARMPGWIDYAVSVLPYGMGTPLMLVSLAGVVWEARRGSASGGVVLAFATAYWLMLGFDNWRLIRYTVPVLAPLCLLGARCVVEALGEARRAAIVAVAAVAILPAFLHSAAYTGAMTHPDPRLQALRWLHAQAHREAGRRPLKIGVPKREFHSVPAPPHAVLTETGYDWERLLRSDVRYLVVSDFYWLDYKEAARHWPKEADFISKVESGRPFRRAASFENPMTFLGYSPGKDRPPHDWLYPNAAVTIYRRETGPRSLLKGQ